ncbi:MAG: Na+/H+ antiporter NhaA [Myroides sp.]
MNSKSTLAQILSNEKAPGILLILCTIFSLIIANSAFGDTYHHFWTTMLPLGNIEFWINDGLMAVFFLFVGLELKKEIYTGELSNVKSRIATCICCNWRRFGSGCYLYVF